MEIQRGDIFRNAEGFKCHVANTFYEGELKVITFRYWKFNRWYFETQFQHMFLIAFKFGLCKWEKQSKSDSVK